jgi:hypothetical protein
MKDENSISSLYHFPKEGWGTAWGVFLFFA